MTNESERGCRNTKRSSERGSCRRSAPRMSSWSQCAATSRGASSPDCDPHTTHSGQESAPALDGWLSGARVLQ